MSAALHIPAEPDPSEPSWPEPSWRVEAAAFVLALRSRGISDLAILRAMERVPRELFAPRRLADLSRQDVALPLPGGQTMTAPGTVAAMLAALAVRPNHRVLEIGTGSGYATALLVETGGLVLSLERHPALAESAARRLDASGYASGCGVLCGDGFALDDGAGPFDRILLNGAVPTLPPALLGRLAPEGRLVCGHVGPGGARLLTITRGRDGALNSRAAGPLRLARLVLENLNGPGGRATEA